MRRLVVDIETSMLDPENLKYNKKNFVMNVASLACICAIDSNTGEKFVFHDNEDLPRYGTNIEGIKFLMSDDVEVVIGHNFRGFDMKALMILYPDMAEDLGKVAIFDTLSVARELFTWKELGDYDRKYNIQHTEYNAKSLNSLGAWGDRLRDRLGLDLAKDDEFKAIANWTNLEITQELIDYCMQDVTVNVKVYEVMLKKFKRNAKEAKNG